MSRFKSLLFAALLIAVLVVLPTFAQPSVITFSSFQSDPVPRAVDEALVADWNALNPETPVELSTVAHEDFKQAIRTYLVADPAPDVLTWFAGNRARFFIDRDLILPFTDAWEANGYDDVYGAGFNALATVGEDKYFLPTSYYWWAVYYRPSLFEAAGITEPVETWDDLLAACDSLNAIGVAPFTIGTKFRWPAAGWFDYINMRTNGPQFHIDLMLLKESYTDERVKQTFANWAQLFEHNCFIEDPAAYDWNEALDFMAQGEAAMYLIGDFVRNSYPDELEADLDFFRFPIIDPEMPIGEDAPTDGYFIPKNAANPEGAKNFLLYLGSQEVQQAAFDERGSLPTRTDVDISGATPGVQKGIDLILSADFIAQFYDRDTTPEMADAGMNVMVEFWDDPSLIDDLLEALDEERIRLAELQAAEE
ncbi:MAG: carbohydrate ABC transporter substrate-binding protein [Anaerolineae bacterium]|nr:carbohydrate ABC transporter substrate-binding protein [Chloroflexota bacterium]MBP6297746.1 carbohydrate ABC transporter substrate-binding protein [Anaerolineae bacterium]